MIGAMTCRLRLFATIEGVLTRWLPCNNMIIITTTLWLPCNDTMHKAHRGTGRPDPINTSAQEQVHTTNI